MFSGKTRKERRAASPGDFWASYSDLMAGLLMVFGLALMLERSSYLQLVAPLSKKVEEWRETLQRLCRDKEFKANEGVFRIDCDTGQIDFKGDVLFDLNSAKLKDKGKQELRRYLLPYLSKLRKFEKFQSRIEAIEISGHTDTRARNPKRKYLYNLELSQRRALAVMEFLESDEEFSDLKDFLEARVVVAGYAYSRPPSEKCKLKDGEAPPECHEKMRRIEVRIRTRDSDIVTEFWQAFQRFLGRS